MNVAPPQSRRRQCAAGFTLVELMVGMSVGLALMAGAFALAGIQLGEHHRLLLELQMQQELRATAELMLRDLRRAGFWDRAQDGLWQPDAPVPTSNPYGGFAIEESGQRLSYRYAREAATSGDAGIRESSGFRLSDGRIDQWIAGRFQPLTDPALLRVLRFEARVDSTAHPLGDTCDRPCTTPAAAAASGGTSCAPVLQARVVTLSIDAEAAHDRRVRQQASWLSRLPNDTLAGGCP